MTDKDRIEPEVAGLVAQALSHALVSPLNSIERRAGRIIKPPPSSGKLEQYNKHLENIFKSTSETRYLISKKRDAIRRNLELKYPYEQNQFINFISDPLENYIVDVDKSVRSFCEFADSLLETIKDKRILHNIKSSSQQFREIYRGIQRFAAQHGEGINTNCDLNSQISVCLSLLDRTKFGTIEIFGKAKLHFDQTLLRSILIEILTNSLKYSGRPEKPKLRIDIDQVWDAAADRYATLRAKTFGQAHSMCQISIQDNGVGIPEDELEAVFNLGYRSPAVRESIEGTGSGLAICRFFIERAGGLIWITSEHLSETTVHFIVPN